MMIVVAIIALLVTLALPAFLRAGEQARNSKFLNDTRTFGGAIDLHATEQGFYPIDGSSGTIPPTLVQYIKTTDWTRTPSIGGVFDVETNDSGVGCAVGAVGIDTTGPWLARMDRQWDDDDFGDGAYQIIRSGGYYLIVADQPVIEAP